MTQNIREFNFDTDIEATLARIKELLLVKGKEYRRNNNPYHNFERGAEIRNKSPFEVMEMSTSTFYNRIKRGWSIDEIIETPIRKINGTFVKDE